jgi:hypothetical protein
MSDTSQGPGWWLASDGKWYPPDAWTGPPMAPETAWPAVAAPATWAAQPYPGSPGMMAPAVRQTNGLAVASLVASCVGVVPFFFGLPCVLGIIFGFVAKSQIRRTNGMQQGAGMALAGIIVGFTLIGLFIIFIIVIASLHLHSCGTNRICTGN